MQRRRRSRGGFAALDQLGVAREIVSTLFQAAVYTLGLTLVIKFGVGGVASARDRFWPKVYDRLEGPASAPIVPPTAAAPAAPLAEPQHRSVGLALVGLAPVAWPPTSLAYGTQEAASPLAKAPPAQSTPSEPMADTFPVAPAAPGPWLLLNGVDLPG